MHVNDAWNSRAEFFEASVMIYKADARGGERNYRRAPPDGGRAPRWDSVDGEREAEAELRCD